MGVRAARLLGLLLLIAPSFGFEWPGRVERIRHALERVEPRERKELVRELGHYPAAAVENALLFALEDGDLEVRLEAADAAGRVRLKAGVPLLMDWLDDKEALARRAAVTALGRIREPRAQAALVRALGDASADVRRAAVEALRELGQAFTSTPGASGPTTGAEVVVPIAGRLDDLDLSVRVTAIEALSALHDARALVPLLGAALDASAELRALALGALGALGDAQALPALTRALADEVDDVRLAAAAALGQLGDPGAVRPLRAALTGAELRVAQAIITALGRIDDDGARAALIEQLSSTGLRGAAADALQLQAAQLAREIAANQAPPRSAGAVAPQDAAAAASADALISGLTGAVDGGGDGENALAAATALAEVARVLPLAGPALERTLAALPAADAPIAAQLMRALGASAAPNALMVLVERLAQSEGEALGAVLAGLREYVERAEPDGRAADPLLEALPRAAPAQRLVIVELLGKVRATRAVATLAPLLEHADGELRRVTAEALAAIGSSTAAPALLQALDHDAAATRFAAAEALASVADAKTVRRLLERVISPTPGDMHALLIPVGPALARLASGRALTPALAKSAEDVLTALIRGDDDALAVRALDATGQWAPVDKALPMLSYALRSRASLRRAAATAAAFKLPADKVRPIARYIMTQGSVREKTAALATLGEVGDHRDLKAIFKVAKKEHWPVPGAVAHTLYRLARRGMLRAFADKPDLCALGASREPYVRANVAATMAALALDSCGAEGPDPLRWLDPQHAPAVRVAAARWTQAARAAGRVDAVEATRALERCASTDIEESVRAACAGAGPSKDSTAVASYVYDTDGVTLLHNGLYALRLSDGAVRVGYADANGLVRVPAAPLGEVRLEDPSQTRLEPID